MAIWASNEESRTTIVETDWEWFVESSDGEHVLDMDDEDEARMYLAAYGGRLMKMPIFIGARQYTS